MAVNPFMVVENRVHLDTTTIASLGRFAGL
jgi:hypothetical protein